MYVQVNKVKIDQIVFVQVIQTFKQDNVYVVITLNIQLVVHVQVLKIMIVYVIIWEIKILLNVLVIVDSCNILHKINAYVTQMINNALLDLNHAKEEQYMNQLHNTANMKNAQVHHKIGHVCALVITNMTLLIVSVHIKTMNQYQLDHVFVEGMYIIQVDVLVLVNMIITVIAIQEKMIILGNVNVIVKLDISQIEIVVCVEIMIIYAKLVVNNAQVGQCNNLNLQDVTQYNNLLLYM